MTYTVNDSKVNEVEVFHHKMLGNVDIYRLTVFLNKFLQFGKNSFQDKKIGIQLNQPLPILKQTFELCIVYKTYTSLQSQSFCHK